MTAESSLATPARGARDMLNKVPEITVWFWVIKILCTTVGESFADWINMTLGVGLINTAIIFTAVLAAVIVVQMRLRRYVPVVYWLAVVVVSITGTLYTDILTDHAGVPLKVSTGVFTVALAVVFAIWYSRERTLSIHSITTTPREGFYWLAVLVTFALGTAVGDWTVELTGWGPGTSILLPAGLIAVVVIGWRVGGQPVLAFWLAYILTRPLGANIGDWLAGPRSEKGLGLGTAVTSVVFLAAIAATVAYLTWSRTDVTAEAGTVTEPAAHPSTPGRHRLAVALYVVATCVTVLVLHHTSQQPHASAAEEGDGSHSSTRLTPAQVASTFPATDVTRLRALVGSLAGSVDTGNHGDSLTRAKDLETTWDNNQSRLQKSNATTWTFLDGEIDDVLNSVRASSPDPAAEKKALTTLAESLGG